ncbi:TetR family transcriptional regulator [Idiomarina tyrosinivorans]|nr:TetR family transcriptional regulator [Idiomarina tyrosinivorans]
METRSHLLDAAEQLFSERGVTNTSMMQVAEAAGVTRGAIYHHFRNKLDLINSLMERVMLPIDEMREQVAQDEKNQNPLKQIALRTKEYVGSLETNPHARALSNILFHKCEYIDDVLPIKMRHLSGRNECIDEMAKLFNAAIDKQQIPASVDSVRAVIGLFSLIDGLVYNWLLDTDYFPLSATAEQAINAYLDGLARAA